MFFMILGKDEDADDNTNDDDVSVVVKNVNKNIAKKDADGRYRRRRQ